jgi:AraC-like DNA-binding protein
MSFTTQTLKSNIVLRHVDTTQDERSEQMAAWRGQLDHYLDISVGRQKTDTGFTGKMERYTINNMVYMESLTDVHFMGRSIARLSKDNLNFFCFCLTMEGDMGSVEGLFKADTHGFAAGRCLLALDIGQMFRLHRPVCRAQAFIVPRAMVEAEFPDIESLHGRIIRDNTPLTHMIFNHLAALITEIKEMRLEEAEQAIDVCIKLIIETFGKQTKLKGSTRAAVRAVMFSQARRYIDGHLDDETLSAEILLKALNLPRATLYRLFEHEGGVEAYIRNRRLRAAAFDLVKHTELSITEVAYSLGFKNLPDFTRAFKRAYDLSPSDLRATSQQLILPDALRELEPMFNLTR